MWNQYGSLCEWYYDASQDQLFLSDAGLRTSTENQTNYIGLQEELGNFCP